VHADSARRRPPAGSLSPGTAARRHPWRGRRCS
jgi:hypothetical protein